MNELPNLGLPQPAYEVKVLFGPQGQMLGVVGPTGMALPAVVDHLATAIKGIAIEMTKQAAGPKLIEVPKIIPPKEVLNG